MLSARKNRTERNFLHVQDLGNFVAVDESGQANAEYILATFVTLVIVVALVGLIGFFGGLNSQEGKAGQSARSEHSSKTFSRAPYTLPSQGAVSEQWLKDLLMH